MKKAAALGISLAIAITALTCAYPTSSSTKSAVDVDTIIPEQPAAKPAPTSNLAAATTSRDYASDAVGDWPGYTKWEGKKCDGSEEEGTLVNLGGTVSSREKCRALCVAHAESSSYAGAFCCSYRSNKERCRVGLDDSGAYDKLEAHDDWNSYLYYPAHGSYTYTCNGGIPSGGISGNCGQTQLLRRYSITDKYDNWVGKTTGWGTSEECRNACLNWAYYRGYTSKFLCSFEWSRMDGSDGWDKWENERPRQGTCYVSGENSGCSSYYPGYSDTKSWWFNPQ